MASSVSVKWGGSTVRISPSEVAAFLRSENGPVLRRFIVLGERVKVQTRASLRSGFPRDFLGPQLVKRIVMAADGPHVIVGADNTKTKPHEIVGNPTLVFFWPKVNAMVFTHHVNHPGSDFGPYLIRQLTKALYSLRGTV